MILTESYFDSKLLEFTSKIELWEDRPIITNPDNSIMREGVLFAITGTGFANTDLVTLGGIDVTAYCNISDEEITFTPTSGFPEGQLVVRTYNGIVYLYTQEDVTLWLKRIFITGESKLLEFTSKIELWTTRPTINTLLNPNGSMFPEGVEYVLNGTYFSNVYDVKISGVSIDFTVVDDGHITWTATDDYPSGEVKLYATNGIVQFENDNGFYLKLKKIYIVGDIKLLEFTSKILSEYPIIEGLDGILAVNILANNILIV